MYTSLANFRGNFEDTNSSALVIPTKRESLKLAPIVSFNFSCKHKKTDHRVSQKHSIYDRKGTQKNPEKKVTEKKSSLVQNTYSKLPKLAIAFRVLVHNSLYEPIVTCCSPNGALFISWDGLINNQ